MRARSTAARMAPHRTGEPVTAVGTTRGLAGQMRATSAATRLANAAPPARPTSPPSTTRPGSRTTATEATPAATRRASSPRNSFARAEGPDVRLPFPFGRAEGPDVRLPFPFGRAGARTSGCRSRSARGPGRPAAVPVRAGRGPGRPAAVPVRAVRGRGRGAAVPVRAGLVVRGRRHGSADRLLGSRRGEAEDAGQHAHHAGADQRLQTSVGRVADVFRQRRPGYRQVTDLPSRPGRPPVHLAAEERRHPEADADPYQDEVVQALGGAAGPLGHRGQVDVVFDDHGPVQRAAQRAEDALMPVGKVDREAGITGLGVHGARLADDERAQPLISTPAVRQACSTAPRTSSTGLAAPLGLTLTSATTRPVTSATPALTPSSST